MTNTNQPVSEPDYPWDYLAGAAALREYLLTRADSLEDADHWRSISDDSWRQVACLLGLTTEQTDSLWGVPGGVYSDMPLTYPDRATPTA
jgi:hypothetical protein